MTSILVTDLIWLLVVAVVVAVCLAADKIADHLDKKRNR